MRALSAHLRDPEAHARFGFHPSCPICRSERLCGTLASDAVFPQRVRATLAASVLAVTSVGPAPALAGEPDLEQDGPAAAQTAGDRTTSPDDEPGGEAAELPDQGSTTGSAPPGPHDDGAWVGQPPPGSDDDDAPPAQAKANGRTIDKRDEAVTASGNEQPTAPAVPPAVQPPAPTAMNQPLAPASSPLASEAAAPRAPAKTRARGNLRHTHRHQTAAAAAPVAVLAVASAPTPPASAAAPTPTTDHAVPNDRSHTVHPGESLWSIASDVLGPGARPARIAREVHRLWELNKDRIATGDPDLLMIDTHLKLR
jgi:nucleoid-associated protein YgaU